MSEDSKLLKEKMRDIGNYLFKEVYFNHNQLKITYNEQKDTVSLPILSKAYTSTYYRDLALYKAKNLLQNILPEYIDVSYNAIHLKTKQVHLIHSMLRLQQLI